MKCPNCKGQVYVDSTVDTDWYCGKYYDAVEGHCPECGLLWSWTEVYTFDHCEDVRQIEPDNHL